MEAAVYFCCVEAVRAGTGPTSRRAADDRGDAAGRCGSSACARRPIDVQAIEDRVEAAGGTAVARSGARLTSRPCRSSAGRAPASPRQAAEQAVRTERRLGDVRRRPAAGDVELVLVVGRQQHDDRAVGSGGELAGGLDPVDAGQVDVHQHQVGRSVAAARERLLAGRRDADDDETVGLLDRRRASPAGTAPGRRRPGPGRRLD